MKILELRRRLLAGLVIPAHPLALDRRRRLDERHQRALTRYFLDSGAGGLAVGVHTTQFAIHDPAIGLLQPVLSLAAEEAERFAGTRPVMIAGIVGDTRGAVGEAGLATSLGYDAGLLSLSALSDRSVDDLIDHARSVAEVIPIIGFYLQAAVGGRLLPYDFWHRFAEIPNVVAIKIAPFNRYQTLDVVRAVADVQRLDEIALYTGNDDNIVVDLLTTFPFAQATITGGLLGHWAVWTQKAVQLLERIKSRDTPSDASTITGMDDWMTLSAQVTDCNAAFFDAANGFAGCIAGIHEVLVRQGLLSTRLTLDPQEDLSPGQAAQIDRVHAAYPHLNDDTLVTQNRDRWLSG